MKKLQSIFIFMVIWQMIAMIVQHKIFPTPITVLLELKDCFDVIIVHIGYSFVRLVAGVFLAVLIGVPIGILLGYFKKVGNLFIPMIYMLGPVPKVALLPLIMLVFGIGNMSKIFIIFIIVVFQIIIVTCDAVKNIPEQYYQTFKVVRAKPFDMIKHIVIPSVMPELGTSLRVGLTTSISVLFFAENFGTQYGLGFYIMDKWMIMDYPQMYLGICTMGIVGLVSVGIIDLLEKRLCPWK